MAIPPRAHRRLGLTLVTLGAATLTTLGLLPLATSYAAPHHSLKQAKHQVAALHNKAEQASERYNQARVMRKNIETRLHAVEKRVKAQQGEVDAMEAKVGGLASATYQNAGFGSEMRLILSDNPREFLQNATALQQVTRRQSTVLSGVVQARRILAADQKLLVQQEAQLAKVRKQLAQQKSQVKSHLAKAQSVVDHLEAKQRAKLEAERQAAIARASRASRSYTGPASGRAGTAVSFAYAQLGKPYEWGADGPSSYDCSGLTMAAWRQAGVSLPHSSSGQYSGGRKVAKSDLQPGDLVFYYSPIHHVGIYVGGGMIIDAPNSSTPVRKTSLDSMPYSGAVRP